MKNYEKLEIQAKLLRMVEGADLEWWQCIKHDGDVWDDVFPPFLDGDISRYELALAIVEGKPVFKGDRLWHSHYGNVVVGSTVAIAPDNANCFSWNPPKPKTMTIELTEEDVKYWINLDKKFNYIRGADEAARFYNAIHNAKSKE